ncbi:MAG: hypothetical protein IPN49_00400 [Saprospiraceae bacterium]|nr:hypothetical protein [Saprospiraceae bacterium]MBK6565515.1 hypothetical protein [Saprospiraceae bacterium]MBK6784004.1 hypothetical protein [Saprospiraceae bacterium]MBK6785629.1 hypothetical protein [Saprospiraceae bacterium]MBK7523029.1 hypothetical protein [Saprospiraceae bacterium]
MHTTDIIKEIKSLPLKQRIIVLEETLKSIKNDEIKLSLEQAADELHKEYTTDKELTAFTALDFEEFYETK